MSARRERRRRIKRTLLLPLVFGILSTSLDGFDGLGLEGSLFSLAREEGHSFFRLNLGRDTLDDALKAGLSYLKYRQDVLGQTARVH